MSMLVIDQMDFLFNNINTIIMLILVIVVPLIILNIVTKTVLKLSKSNSFEETSILSLLKLIRYCVFIIIFLACLDVMGINIHSLFVSLGLVSVAMSLAAKDTLSNVNWYVLYNKCMKLNASDKVKSRMVWGLQWDLTCDFISKKGDKKSIKNSSSWGNYVNAVGNVAVMVGTTKMYGSKQVTGYSEYWKANNIYDLAGNCEEWSQEAGYDRFRAGRGGSCTMDGAELLPASARNKGGSYGYDPNLRNTPSTNNKIGEKYGKSNRRKRNNINRINSYDNNFANISWNNRRIGNKCNT